MARADLASPHNSERRKKRRSVAYPRLHEALLVWMKAIEKEEPLLVPYLKPRQPTYSLVVLYACADMGGDCGRFVSSPLVNRVTVRAYVRA